MKKKHVSKHVPRETMTKKAATAAEQRYMGLVAELGCIVCRNLGYGATPAGIHHIRTGQGGSQRAPHHLIIPLCPGHHQTGGEGVAFHAGERQWQSLYGSELNLLAQTISEVIG